MATVQEYQARNTIIDDQITKLAAQAQGFDTEAETFEANAAAWNADKSSCKRGSGYAACIAHRDDKVKEWMGYAQSRRDSAKAARDKIKLLQDEFEGNLDLIAQAQATADQVSKVLANQGTTLQAVQTTANAQAEAIKMSGAAQARSIEQSSQADATNKKRIGLVVAIAAAVAVGILVWVLIKRIKKK